MQPVSMYQRTENSDLISADVEQHGPALQATVRASRETDALRSTQEDICRVKPSCVVVDNPMGRVSVY